MNRFPSRLAALLLATLLLGRARAESTLPGQPSLNIRARYENVNQDGRREAEALTIRTRLGWTSPTRDGLRVFAEVEDIRALDGNRYDQAGINAGGAGRAVVADPVGTELNQAWLTWSRNDTTVTIGRQRLVLDDARFIGDVGWRQNMQTFDAVTLVQRLPKNSVVTLAYLDRVNRVFGHRHPQGSWESRSGVLHFARTGLPGNATVAAYASVLDFPSAAAQSCATAGFTAQGARQLTTDLRLTWKAGLALQSDHGSNPADYSTRWLTIEAGLAGTRGQFALGGEELGSDNGRSFRTPLATLHAFNGWADLFLTTPTAGLRDSYARAVVTLPQDIALTGWYHRFDSARGGRCYGDEVDLQASRRFGRHVTALAKFAAFRAASPGLPDVRKFWLQVEFAL